MWGMMPHGGAPSSGAFVVRIRTAWTGTLMGKLNDCNRLYRPFYRLTEDLNGG